MSITKAEMRLHSEQREESMNRPQNSVKGHNVENNESRTNAMQFRPVILARHLPEELFERPKRGFGMPIEQWYRGPLRNLLVEYTSAARVRNRGLLNNEALQSAVRDHLSGRRNFARKLHAIVAFEIWADRHF